MAPTPPLFHNSGTARYSRSPLLASTAMALTLAVAPAARAIPENPTVVTGAVTVTTVGSTGAQTQTITQTSSRAILTWGGFNLTKDDVVNFQQLNSRAVTVNRVTGTEASAIDGKINANGRVFIINPRGVVFGTDAQINVNTLIASTADITEQNLTADQYVFDQPSTVAGAVISNAGQITVADTGMAGLFGPSVVNTGTIIASVGTTHGGAIALGAGRTFSVDFAGDGLITFDVTSGVETRDFGLLPTDLISNASGGLIQADAGSVVMTALQASAIVDGAINIGGTVAANSVSSRNGLIELDGRGGDVTVSGTVRALGDNAGERGGRITIGGDTFTAANGAVIDASGLGAPGGTIQAGTSAAGTGDPLRTIEVNAGATIRASGASGAIAGQTRLAASQSLTVNGTVTAVSTNGTGGGVTLAAPDITLGTNITTSNVALTLSGATTLASDVTINTGTGSVLFNGTVNGAQALTVNSNGLTSFSGLVGGNTPLASLTTNQGGSANLVGAVTTGQQSYADAVTLTGAYTSAGGFNASGRDAGTVQLNGTTSITNVGGTMSLGTINGQNSALTLNNGSGGLTLRGATLSSLTRLGTGSLTLRGGTYQVGGVTNDLRLGDITIGGTVNFATNATLGRVTFDSASTIASSAPRLTIGSISATGLGVNFAGNNGSDIRVNGPVDAASLTSAATAFTLRLLGGGATTGSATFANSDLVYMAGDFRFAGGMDATKVGDRTIIDGSVSTENRDIKIGAMTLNGATSLSSGDGNISLNGAMEGSFALTLNSAGTTMLNGAVGGTTPLGMITTDAAGVTELSTKAGRITAQGLVINDTLTFVDGGTGLTIDAPVTFGTKSVTLAGTQTVSFLKSVQMGADETVWTNGTSATHFGGTVAGKHLTANGQTTFAADVTLDSLTADRIVVESAGDAKVTVKATGQQNYTGTLTMNNAAELEASKVVLTGRLNGSNTAVKITGAFEAQDSAIEIKGGSIAVTGDVELVRTTVVVSDGGRDGTGVQFRGSANLTDSSVTVSQSLQIDGLAPMVQSSPISQDGPIMVSGTATLNNATVTTKAGAITFAGDVKLPGKGEVGSDNGTITFSRLVEGAGDLTVNTKGDTVFAGAVTVGNLSTDAGGKTTTGTSLTATQKLVISDDLSLTGDAVLTAASIELAGTAKGAHALKLSSPTTVLKGDVEVASLHTDMAGTTTMGTNAGTIKIVASGEIDIGDTLTLAGNAAMTGRTIKLSNMVDSEALSAPRTLTLSSTEGTSIIGNVGTKTTLESLTVTGTATLGADKVFTATTSKGQEFGGPVILAADTTLNGGSLTFKRTVDSDKTARTLTLNSGGATQFVGDVGVKSALAALTTDVSGTTILGGIDSTTMRVHANGPVTFNDNVTLMSDVLLAVAGDLRFKGTVMADTAAAGRGLIANATGAIVFDAAVGTDDDRQLASLVTNAVAGSTVGSLTVTQSDARAVGSVQAGSVHTTGNQTYNGTALTLAGTLRSNSGNILVNTGLVLASDSVLTAGGNIGLGRTVEGAGRSLSLNAARTDLLEAVGGNGALRSLAVTGVVSAVNVTTTSDQLYSGATTLNGSRYQTGGGRFQIDGPAILGGTGEILITTGTGNAAFNGTLNGARSLRIDSSGVTRFNGVVGGDNALTALTTDASGSTAIGGNASAITVRDVLSWGETTALERDVTMNAREVSFTGSVWSAGNTPVALGVNGTTSVTFKNLVGVRDEANRNGADPSQALRNLTVSGGKIIIDTTATPNGMIIRTAGNLQAGAGRQSYAAALDITGGTVLFDTANAGALPADDGTGRGLATNPLPGGELQFGQMNASKADVIWFLGSGAVAAPGGAGVNPAIDLASLRVVGVGGSATLTGSIAGVTGGVAAQRVRKQLPRSNDYRLNDCAMGSPSCVVTSVPALPVPQSVNRPDFPEPPRLEEEDVRRVSRGNEDLW